jgi:tetratricopeptide (TPR) repeat protein
MQIAATKGAMASFPDNPIFEPREQESLKTNQYLFRYTAITKNQLVGLLVALGEYAARIELFEQFVKMNSNNLEVAEKHRALMEMASPDPEAAEKRRALVGFYNRQRDPSDTASSGQFVFDSGERSFLSLHKYIRGGAYFTKQDVLGLLEALGRFSLNAPRIEQSFGIYTKLVRLIHAHNALVSFRDKPFTLHEFCESVSAVLEGENSRLTKLAGAEQGGGIASS